MFNNKKIKELTEKIEKLEKRYNLLIDYLSLTEKYEISLPYPSLYGIYYRKKELIGYEPIKKCKTCNKIQNDNFKN